MPDLFNLIFVPLYQVKFSFLLSNNVLLLQKYTQSHFMALLLIVFIIKLHYAQKLGPHFLIHVKERQLHRMPSFSTDFEIKDQKIHRQNFISIYSIVLEL